MPIKELRPAEVLEAYWEEVINIEQEAIVLDPVYVEVSA